ncbi:hypothetical protein PN462_02305 [Spirulina sp. CS-785/01]|nr:hypothetical protein [Spirulina sp. CS-785/01]MDB9311919.1 hypothetical protein [Spirulina sp. CS-785/01]
MNNQQHNLINKAQESLNAAKLLKANNCFDYGVGLKPQPCQGG